MDEVELSPGEAEAEEADAGMTLLPSVVAAAAAGAPNAAGKPPVACIALK